MENLHPTSPTNSLHQLRRKPLSRALKTSTLRWQWLRVVSATKILDGKFQTIAQQVKAEGRAQGRACSSWTSGHQRNLRKQTLCSKQKLDTVSVFQSRNIATRCSMPRKKSCDSPNEGSWRHTRTDDVSRQFWIMGRIVNHSYKWTKSLWVLEKRRTFAIAFHWFMYNQGVKIRQEVGLGTCY